jgi:hypothetical protein
MRALPSVLLTLALGLSAPVRAVLIDSGDGTGNTSAPAPDPGWDHVGSPQGLSAVYLGDGVVITANHVGPGDLTLDGVVYPWVPGSGVRLDNGDGTYADLILFAVFPAPPLPSLPIAASTPLPGTEVVMVGRGRNRGATITWDPDGPPAQNAYHGYAWAPGVTIRWGTNHLAPYPLTRIFDTEAISTRFDEGASAHEAQAASGDSGGAVFAWNGADYELAGIMIAVSEYEGQPSYTSLYSQLTYAADLAFYRDQIEDWIALPEPAGGGWAGAALLAALARRRRPPRDAPRSDALPQDA